MGAFSHVCRVTWVAVAGEGNAGQGDGLSDGLRGVCGDPGEQGVQAMLRAEPERLLPLCSRPGLSRESRKPSSSGSGGPRLCVQHELQPLPQRLQLRPCQGERRPSLFTDANPLLGATLSRLLLVQCAASGPHERTCLHTGGTRLSLLLLPSAGRTCPSLLWLLQPAAGGPRGRTSSPTGRTRPAATVGRTGCVGGGCARVHLVRACPRRCPHDVVSVSAGPQCHVVPVARQAHLAARVVVEGAALRGRDKGLGSCP